ncbi:DUF7144 family membrane protein [Nocardiopsis composta]|uniref:DUF7144 domain-containing protein n=1 Tax=Nocardiopsis composta TaxID=157465 RepID=A0A7W8QJC0_9ACTN|nr:hypothetical protein [Nocardiopsis composta]MBB5430833.1 hypothetical protein [Nocardiopsis composta]
MPSVTGKVGAEADGDASRAVRTGVPKGAPMVNGRPSGWRVFAACLLVFAGAANFVQGVVAGFVPEYYLAAEGQPLVTGYALWGMLLASWGAVLVVAGVAVAYGRMWARVFGVAAAGLNAVAQMLFLDAYPVWSVLVILADGVVVYGLTAGWSGGAAAGPVPRAREEAYLAGHLDADHAPVPGDERREPEKRLHFGKHERTLD